MNERTIQHNRLLIPAFAMLLCMTLGLLLTAGVFAEPSSATDASELVAGSYDGSVTVSEPAPLGELHLRLDVTSANGRLAGAVNPLKTQVFLGGPTFTGQVTVTHGVTTTVRIESELFSSMISGRAIQRRFILTGAVLENGNTLRGNYTEMILGFN
ncbi:MAG: hypothetical protein KDE31_19105, partial [Caldilineaceae bacterium]|nr:hypothetical protein [Caldilineaceae bacterium]